MMLSINKTLTDLIELEEAIALMEKFIEQKDLGIDTKVLLQKYFDDYFII